MTRVEDMMFTTNGWNSSLYSCNVETDDKDVMEYLLFKDGRVHYNFPRGFENKFRFPIIAEKKMPKIKDVIFNDPATIVFWSDGSKTVVKIDERYNDKFNEETGLAMAICKKAFGNNGSFNEIFKKWIWDKNED